MPKSKRFLSSKPKKKRRNAGLIKWVHQSKERRSNNLQSSTDCITMLDSSTDQETQPDYPRMANAETFVSYNEFASTKVVLMDHSYTRSLPHGTNSLTTPKENEDQPQQNSFQHSEIACCSTPQPGISRPIRRKLVMDSEEQKKRINESNVSEEPLLVDEFLSNTAPDGVPFSHDVQGRRVINFSYFLQQIKTINEHNRAFGCTISNCYISNERFSGLKTKFTLKCNMCNETFSLHSEYPELNTMDINTASVAGAMVVGIFYSQMTELFANMEIPYMAFKTYNKAHEIVADAWEETALSEMKAAALEEIEFATDNGKLSPDGIPILTVVADGTWAKRSYRTNYNSLAGVAAIVGSHTKKVIFLGVRNKYCTICARAASSSREAPKHVCYKNWPGCSTSMEADIILEGFMNSMDMYGVIYGKILADGDSSVYASIIEARPYPNLTVEKIECTNHLLRNYCNKLREITVTAKSGPIGMRKIVGKNILRLRSAVTKAIDYRRVQEDGTGSNKITALAKDIINGPSHVFGEHSNCDHYFCKGPKKSEVNHIPQLRETGMFYQIMTHANYLADNSRSLLKKMNNNAVEHYNSIVCKFIGGKRVNYAVKRSYKARCLAAAVSYNSGQPLYKLHKQMYKKSPGGLIKSLQASKLRKIRKKYLKRKEKTGRQQCKPKKYQRRNRNDKYYGESSMKPDLPQTLYNRKAKDFLKALKKSDDERHDMERGTMLQAGSGRWMKERRKLLIASNFATVCKRRQSTSCQNLVKSLLYKDFDTPSTAYGRQNEPLAIRTFEDATGLKVKKCGLFVDKELPYLGATPDGLVGDDGLVEVKCPASCKALTPEEGILNKKITFWHVNKKTNSIGPINKSHNYFFQVQGQLHITERQHCYLAMWTPLGIKIEKVERDDAFWEKEMCGKLKQFYLNCLLPELVDPRHTRSMPIKDPLYIMDAKHKKEMSSLKK